MDLGFKGKVAVVTGGASNIGRAISIEFAREEAIVVILDRDTAQAEKTTAEIAKAGGRVFSFALDVTDVEGVKKVIAEVEDKIGPVEVLVNNVGWGSSADFFLNITPEHWEKSFKLNLFSNFNVTHAVLSRMVPRRSGSIVSISSDAAIGAIALSDYSAMKAGVLAFTRVLAKEYGKYNISFNTITPGNVVPEPEDIGEGSLWKHDNEMSPKVIDKITHDTPMRRLPKAVDIAWTTLFLASEKARMLTGQFVSVSGGYVMPR